MCTRSIISKPKKKSTATIYRVIKRAETDSGYLRRVGSGRRAFKMPNFKVNQLKRLFNNNDKVSIRQAASKFKIYHSYVSKLIKKKTNIQKRTKTKIPYRNQSQQDFARPKCSATFEKISKTRLGN